MLGIPEDVRVIGYLGSVGSWYMLDEMFDFFRVYRERHPDARFLFVTPSPPDAVLAPARERGVEESSIIVRSASREEVPHFMAAADTGLFFIKPVYSKKASSPTKMAELIALGLPIVTNGGVGDVTEIVEETGCGVAIDEFTDAAYRDAIERVERLPIQPSEVRARAEPMFDVDLAIGRYDSCYRAIAAERSPELPGRPRR
jgi:glycosyltransferase involved in cell wall biosynthesis